MLCGLIVAILFQVLQSKFDRSSPSPTAIKRLVCLCTLILCLHYIYLLLYMYLLHLFIVLICLCPSSNSHLYACIVLVSFPGHPHLQSLIA